MQRCNVQSAEDHIFRRKPLDYTREDLRKNNFFVEIQPIREALALIRKRYREATGQRLQPNAAPIREIVVYGPMSPEKAEGFKDQIEKRFGIKVLSYAYHADEGHYEKLTHEWMPNLHTHYILDITRQEHSMIRRPMKCNGKILRDENNQTVYVEVDGYGKNRHFSRQDLRDLQKLAAGATGFARGTEGSRRHIKALQYKVQMLEKDIQELTEMKESALASVNSAAKQVENLINIEKEMLIKRAGEVEKNIKETIQEAEDTGIIINRDHISDFAGRVEKAKNEEYERTEDFNANLRRVISNAVMFLKIAQDELQKGLKEKAKMLKKEASIKKELDDARAQLAAENIARGQRREACRQLLENYDTEEFDGMKEYGLADAIGRDIWDEVVDEIVEERNSGYGVGYV